MQRFFMATAMYIFLVTFSNTALAITLHVPAEYPTIQAGINAAAVGDTVILEPGIYNGDGNRDIDFIGKDITVRSSDGNPATCTILCQGTFDVSHRGFTFQSGESALARLQGVTISGGYINYDSENLDGGGILCANGSSPTISNCRVTNCFAYNYGGGLSAADSSPTIRDCQFDNNVASFGGGVAVRGNCPLVMIGSRIMNNQAPEGGGAYLNAFSSFLNECIIANNSGKGIFAPDIFSLTYSTVIGNGYGIQAYGGITVENSLIAFNYLPFYDFNGDDIQLNCCNVFGNRDGDWPDIIAEQQGINGNISADPLLCDPDNWDYHVAPNSPCLNDLCGQIGAFGAGNCGDPATPAGDGFQVAFGLRGNYPNPFNPSTTISYELDQDSPITLQIFDVTGKLIRTLENGNTRTAGTHETFWNGRDNSGHRVAAGVFLYVLTSSTGQDTGRMALIK